MAEALKINASITDIDLRDNQIGAEGAKARCGVGSAEHLLNAATCHGVPVRVTSLDGLEVLQFHGSSLIERCPTCTVAAAQDLL